MRFHDRLHIWSLDFKAWWAALSEFERSAWFSSMGMMISYVAGMIVKERRERRMLWRALNEMSRRR